ncbi:glycosyl hydrolase [Spongiactinospora rosea]|uniref:Glycosyl hydrolase n=1 Tax=Spongiactinospora rosea TaxID=2248750 RepID=A0A366LIY3_9ACTN|nr:family 10 glycosylhydrolase [Spongiactinospora rosea]RBQ13847.1 glycosyl hydrolase [Spongiactinospora rosea]
MDRRVLLRGLAASAAAGPLASLFAQPSEAAVPMIAPAAAPLRQMRGMWIASVLNINWPSKPGLSPDQQRAEFRSWLDLAVARKLNSVFVQIRPAADAFWPSPHEPWSEYLTGTQGKDPGYDPLGFAVAEAHKRGLAFHGWFNPYRVSMQGDLAKLHPDHPGRRHPEWIVAYGGRLYYNPGLPEVRAFVQDAMMDAVTRYDLDGLHFDDYFYPVNTAAFDDSAAFAKYGSGFPDLAAWRRDNVDRLVREMQQRVRAAKPEVAWGISPSGIWRNKGTDPLGSDTNGSQSYDNLHADTRGWVKKGLLDYIAPQIYWNIGFTVADYAKLAPWWADVAAGTGVQLWIGQAAYKVAASGQPAPWFEPGELSSHLTLNRGLPAIGGDIWYNAADVRADRIGSITKVVADHYASPALPPLLPRLASGRSPRRPILTHARRTSAGTELRFHTTGGETPRLCAIYRVTSGSPDPRTGRDLVAVVPGAKSATWTDPAKVRGATYHVTALDAANRQSPLSSGRRPH